MERGADARHEALLWGGREKPPRVDIDAEGHEPRGVALTLTPDRLRQLDPDPELLRQYEAVRA